MEQDVNSCPKKPNITNSYEESDKETCQGYLNTKPFPTYINYYKLLYLLATELIQKHESSQVTP